VSSTWVASVSGTFRYMPFGVVGKVEEKDTELESVGISFVDDVAWVVEGDGVGDCTQ
jgi:hypothetical protein